MSHAPTAYLSDKCEVRLQDVADERYVVARQVIAPGEIIAVWSGRIVSSEMLHELPGDIRRHTVQVEENLYQASLHAHEPPDFINHSCDPNAGMNGQITVVSMRTILPGEEITIDYAMCDGSSYDEFECACGTATCRGRVTGEDWRNPSLWLRYAGYFSPYLQRRIDAFRRQRARRRASRRRVVQTAENRAAGNAV